MLVERFRSKGSHQERVASRSVDNQLGLTEGWRMWDIRMIRQDVDAGLQAHTSAVGQEAGGLWHRIAGVIGRSSRSHWYARGQLDERRVMA